MEAYAVSFFISSSSNFYSFFVHEHWTGNFRGSKYYFYQLLMVFSVMKYNILKVLNTIINSTKFVPLHLVSCD